MRVSNVLTNQSGTTLPVDMAVLVDTDNNGTPGYITVDRAPFGTVTGTEIATDADNDAADGGDVAGLAETLTFTLVEPRVNLTTSISSSTTALDAGDSVTYSYTINNLSGNGATSDARDVATVLTLPASMIITGGNINSTGGVTVDGSSGGMGASFSNFTFTIPLSGSVTITATAQLQNSITPNQALNANFNVTFASIPGAGADKRTGADVTPAPTDNTPPASTTILNNYAVGSNRSVTTISPFVVTSSLVNTSLGNDTSLNVVIGEVLTYQATVGVMEGTTSALSLVETLPQSAGVNLLQFVPGSCVITNANGIAVNGFNVSYDPTTNQLTITATSVVNPGGSNGTTNDPAINETDSFTLTYQATVADVAANQSGSNLANDLDASATGVTADINNQITVNVREPVLTLSVTTTTPGAYPGDAVLYTLVLTNTGNSTAYDIQLTDALNAALILPSPATALTVTGGTGSGYALLTQTLNTASMVNTALNRLDQTDTVTITLSAQVAAGATPSSVVTHSVTATYTSLPGVQSGERTGAGGVDDYTVTTAAGNFTLAAPPDYVVTTSGNEIIITDNSGNSDTLNVTQPTSGNIQFAAATRVFIVAGVVKPVGSSGSISLTGVTKVTINAGAGNDTITLSNFSPPGGFPSLTIHGGIGDDTVNLNNLTFAANANLDIDLQNDDPTPGIDSIVLGTNTNVVLSGTGTATLKASRNINLNNAGLLTLNGAITLEANQQAVPATGAFSGIDTAVHRIAASSFWDSMTLKTCVPTGSAGFRILMGTSKTGVKPRRTNSLLDWRPTKTEIGTTF